MPLYMEALPKGRNQEIFCAILNVAEAKVIFSKRERSPLSGLSTTRLIVRVFFTIELHTLAPFARLRTCRGEKEPITSRR